MMMKHFIVAIFTMFLCCILNLSHGMKGEGDTVVIPEGVGSPSFRRKLANLIRQGKVKIISTTLPPTVQSKKDEKKPKKVRDKGKMDLQNSIKKSVSSQVIKGKKEEKDNVLTEEDDEKTIRELNCWKDFDDFANKIGMINCDDKRDLIKYFDELKNLYEKYSDINECMMKNSSFPFCCGLFAYYLSEESEGMDEIKAWFYDNLKTEMSQENGIKLIENSSGDHAYFFLENLNSENHE